MMMTETTTEYDLKAILGHWGKEYSHSREDIDIAGTPERTLFRSVVECDDGTIYVLERVEEELLQRKKAICIMLDLLVELEMKTATPYCMTSSGDHVIKYNGMYWQMVPYIYGVAIPRPEYLYKERYGDIAADFLIQLRRTTEKESRFNDIGESFSLADYVMDFLKRLKENEPNIYERIKGVGEFFEKNSIYAAEAMPRAIAHGDYHVLNIIWGDAGVNAVIDWEFWGIKGELYDVALMLGCLGYEHPSGLVGEAALRFIKKVKESGIIDESSWKHLVEYVIGTRCAWLADWLLRYHEGMINLEIDYLNTLVFNAETLKEEWGC
jgi:homoserine kinase type II